MRIKANYHTHVSLCNHARGRVIDYVDEAISLGYEELGVSDHAPVLSEWVSDYDYERLYFSQYMKMDEFFNDYLLQFDEVTNKGIKVYIGLETEYVEGNDDYYKMLLSNVDYLILGVHFFKSSSRFINTYAQIDKKTMYDYAYTVEKALSTGMYKILAHPDLFLYSLDYFDEDCRKVSNMIIESCVRHNVYLEINCNGVKGKYPYYDFYKEVLKHDVKLIVGVDAHDPQRLSGNHIDNVYHLIDSLGLKVLDKIEF